VAAENTAMGKKGARYGPFRELDITDDHDGADVLYLVRGYVLFTQK
jgi:hypothetical protein